jgi:uncharacterized protein YndB with AHSA1/START domain
MKVMVLVKASKDSEAGKMPTQELLTEMGKFNEELVKAGIMLAGEGLHPSSKGVRVRFSGKNRMVIDGPFAETKELVAGYWIWQVKSMDEAIAWLKRCPCPMPEESDVEIRPIFSPEDFGAAFTPELQEQEARMQATIEENAESGSKDSRVFITTRQFDAPREKVYRAFSDPKILAKWWGPNGFTNTINDFDLRPGGMWRFVMHGPDGTDYQNVSEFIEVAPNERIVFWHGKPIHQFRMTMSYADEAGKTRLTWRMVFESVEEADKVRGFVPHANEQNFDRLAAALKSMS